MIELEYEEKFGEYPSMFSLESIQRFWVVQQMEMAIKGKRGVITEDEINKKFDITVVDDVLL